MNHRPQVLLLVLILALTSLVACGPKETPEQRLERLRSRHEIRPLGYTTIQAADTGEPITLVDLDLTNKGIEALPKLTVLIRITAADGSIKHSQRVTLDLEGVRPGTGVQTAASLPGIEMAEDDELFVELEVNLTPEDLRSLPEWQAISVS